jgi:hypothetical protein
MKTINPTRATMLPMILKAAQNGKTVNWATESRTKVRKALK